MSQIEKNTQAAITQAAENYAEALCNFKQEKSSNTFQLVTDAKTELATIIRTCVEQHVSLPEEPTEAMIRAGCYSDYSPLPGERPWKDYAEWENNTSSGVVDRVRQLVVKDYRAMVAAFKKENK